MGDTLCKKCVPVILVFIFHDCCSQTMSQRTHMHDGIFADEEYIFVKMKWLSDRKNDY